jgi:hypothetical protein
MRERISLSQIARITGLDPSTIDLWRRDIPGYWKGLAPCPTSPPIRDAYADLERVEFYLDELLIWLDTSRNYRRRLWFENLLNASRSDPEFFEKMEAERRENRRLFRRNRGLVAKMPDSLPYADWKTYDIRRYH